MDRLLEHGVLPRLLLLLVLISLLKLSPRLHQVDTEMKEAGRALKLESTQETKSTQEPDSLLEASRHIANAAGYMQWRSDLWELAGHTALQAGDSRAAVQYLKRAAQTGRETCFTLRCGLSLRGWIDLGDAYQQSGDLTAAIESWLTVLELNGPSIELVERLVKAYVSQGNYSYAISIMQTMVSLKPDDAQLIYRLGLYTATQNPEEALVLLNKAARMDPNLEGPVSKIQRDIFSARVAEDLAYSLVSTGRSLASLDEWDLAAEAFRQATLVRPDYGEAWAYLGEAHQHHDDSRNSSDTDPNSSGNGLPQLEKALELDPKSLAAHTFLALYWKRQMGYDKALPFIRSAVSLDARNPVLQAELASLLAVSGDLDEAYKVYLLAASLSPFDPTYKKYLVGFSMQYDYHIEEIALPVVRQLVIQYPELPAHLDLMAQVLIQQGDLATAERFLARALQMETNFAPAHLHLGLVYILQENREAAYQELNRAISLDTGDVVIDQARRLLETYFP